MERWCEELAACRVTVQAKNDRGQDLTANLEEALAQAEVDQRERTTMEERAEKEARDLSEPHCELDLALRELDVTQELASELERTECDLA